MTGEESSRRYDRNQGVSTVEDDGKTFRAYTVHERDVGQDSCNLGVSVLPERLLVGVERLL